MGYISGMVSVRVLSADISGFLDEALKNGIVIRNTRTVSELEAEITLARRDLSTLEKLCVKRGDKVDVIRKTGLFWRIRGLHRRPVLVTAAVMYILSALFIPSRVFFVRVVGNTSIPERRILEAASDCGIGFGASRRAVRSEKVKNALLEAVPELQWAGVNTAGCVAEISVRERSAEEKTQKSGFGHVVAVTDGIITFCNASRGNLLCAPGQAVAAGDILISGFTDCGLTIRAEQAEGEVYAATRRTLTVITPTKRQSTCETGIELKKISILLGKKRINLWKDSGFWDSTCDRMYEENYITLPGGFQLPVGWCVERCRIRELIPITVNPGELLEDYGESYLKSTLVALTIRNSDLSFYEGDGILQMTGQYGCVEMIGAIQRLEIGELHGKDN